MKTSEEKKAAKKQETIEFINDQITKDFVGEKYPYYKKKWENELLYKKFFSMWSWPAFFLGPIWIAYRKMYLYLLILIAGGPIVAGIEGYFNITIPGIPFAAAIAATANPFYFLSAQRKIDKLKSKFKGENSLREAVHKAGGVNVFAAVLVGLVAAALIAYTVYQTRQG